jgi:tetratricopeptide (TPR) repeat protein
MQDYDQAITYYNKILCIEPSDFKVINNLANIYQLKKEYNQAIFYYNKVVDINPNISEVYKNLGKVYEKLNNHKQAVAYYEKVIGLNPNLPYIYSTILHIKLMNCDFSGLEKLISEVISDNKVMKLLHPYNALYLFNQSSILDVITKLHNQNTHNQKSLIQIPKYNKWDICVPFSSYTSKLFRVP